MGVPKKRKTQGSTGQRRSHHFLTKIQLARCKNCAAPVMPHEVCQVCGFYRGKQVIKIELPKTKTTK
ncbi:MAG: 50S ribosomal protein L32 [bacterium]|nr:50S ribosomal protein L32 [bacterium]